MPNENSLIGAHSTRFDDRVAIVTGAGGGLGRTYAIELALRGAKVVVNDVGCNGAGEGKSTAPADDVVREIHEHGGTAFAVHGSVATKEGGENLVTKTLEAYGRIDILINNAGILRASRFDETPEDDIDAVLGVNLKAAFYVGRPVFRAMKEQQYGRLLFVASASGMFGHPWQAAYSASKAGLVGLSNVLALEGADFGITSNALLPAAMTRLADEIDWTFLEEASEVGQAMALLEVAGDTSERRLGPEWVTPLAVHLVSEQCTATHGVYSAVSGRIARVFIGATSGWTPESPPSVEEVAAMWPKIELRHGFTEPASVYHEAVDAISNQSEQDN